MGGVGQVVLRDPEVRGVRQEDGSTVDFSRTCGLSSRKLEAYEVISWRLAGRTRLLIQGDKGGGEYMNGQTD